MNANPQQDNYFQNIDIYPALQALRPYTLAISFFALLISIVYTVLFNIGQTNSTHFINLFGVPIYYEQVLLAATGILQDSAEVVLFLFALWIFSKRGKKPVAIYALASAALIGSFSLILWSIASTWGGNNAMIDASVAASDHEKQKFQLVQQTIQTNQAAVEAMNRNAAAIRIQAAGYGDHYISRSIDKIKDAQDISEQAAVLAQNSLKAVEHLDKIDTEKLTQSNSALSAFERLGKFLGYETHTVGTTFLVTRATQLELIGIVTGLFTILVPPARHRSEKWERLKDQFTEGANKTFDDMAERAGRGAGQLATANNPGSRFTNSLNRSNPQPQNNNPKPPQPSSNAGSSAFEKGSGTPGTPVKNAPESTDQFHHWDLIKKYVANPKFDDAFVGVATGQTKCSQKQAMKHHGLGGDMAGYFMLILEAWDIASPPSKTNKQRTLIRPLPEAEARAELADIKAEILGTGT